MNKLTNKVILITGAGRGTGRKIALAFASNGAIIAANDLTPINLDETLKEIQSSGGKCKGYVFDIAKRMPVVAMAKQIKDDWGRIDVLVNCANIDPHSVILDMDEWDWQRTIDVNLTGAFFLMQSVGRLMRDQGGGVIINIIPANKSNKESGNHIASATSKAGLIGLTREAAINLTPYNIRVNAIYTGVIDREVTGSSGVGSILSEPTQVDLSKEWTNSSGDVVELVLLLCREEASLISGQIIAKDGIILRC